VRHPEYTFVSAVNQVRDAVERQRSLDLAQGRPAASGDGAVDQRREYFADDWTGPPFGDDFGTMTLPDRIAAYRPGWFASWNDVEDDKMEALAPILPAGARGRVSGLGRSRPQPADFCTVSTRWSRRDRCSLRTAGAACPSRAACRPRWANSRPCGNCSTEDAGEKWRKIKIASGAAEMGAVRLKQ